MQKNKKDHCRIGSLEIISDTITNHINDHCRIGSLEILLAVLLIKENDHCRIGSLENGNNTKYFKAL